MKKYVTTLILIIIVGITLFSQVEKREYQFPNTHIFFPYPNEDFKEKMDEGIIAYKDSLGYLVMAELKKEMEMLADLAIRTNQIDTLIEKKIDGGNIKLFSYRESGDSVTTFNSNIYLDNHGNYTMSLYIVEPKLDYNLEKKIIESFLNVRLDTSKSIDPFLGKSFTIDLTKTSLQPTKKKIRFYHTRQVKLIPDQRRISKGADKTYITISAWSRSGFGPGISRQRIWELIDFENEISQQETWEVIEKDTLMAGPLKLSKYLIRKDKNLDFVYFVYFTEVGSKIYEIEGELYNDFPMTLEDLDEFVKTLKIKKE